MAAGIKSIIGLQNLTNLQQFRADYNHLTSLDVSGLTNLTFLDISDCNRADEEGANSLTTINVSGCTSLESIYIDDSDFSENGIGGIIGLSDVASTLVNFDMDDSYLPSPTTIDFSSFSSIEDIDIQLNIGVTSLIISSGSAINDLNANDCSLTEESVNNILIQLDGNGVTNGYVSLNSGNNATASADGVNAAVSLINKGWTVYLVPSYNNISSYYDLEDTGSICAGTAEYRDVYALSSFVVGEELFRYNFGGEYAADGWYKETSGTDLYFVSGGIVQTSQPCS